MNKYFAIFEKEEKKAPISLNQGILHSELNPNKPFEPLPSDSGEWRYSINKKVKLPNTLWFITKDKEYYFDLRYDSGGFFISNIFLDLLTTFNISNFTATKLNILNKKLEPVTSKEYFYIKFFDNKDVINYSKSKIDYDNKGNLKKPQELIIDPTLVSIDLFMIDNWYFYNRLFCSENFRLACIENNMYGVQFIDAIHSGVFKP